MTIGTRSLLYGVHAFWLHPLFVAFGWWKLYGFPWDPRLWAAFVVHDLGYWGAPNMDGPEGERHPELGARVMSLLFDRSDPSRKIVPADPPFRLGRWARLTLFHSRSYARKFGAEPSRLCFADKLAVCLYPEWLYVALAHASGEIREYMDPDLHEDGGKYEGEGHLIDGGTLRWLRSVRRYLRGWIEENA